MLYCCSTTAFSSQNWSTTINVRLSEKVLREKEGRRGCQCMQQSSTCSMYKGTKGSPAPDGWGSPNHTSGADTMNMSHCLFADVDSVARVACGLTFLVRETVPKRNFWKISLSRAAARVQHDVHSVHRAGLVDRRERMYEVVLGAVLVPPKQDVLRGRHWSAAIRNP